MSEMQFTKRRAVEAEEMMDRRKDRQAGRFQGSQLSALGAVRCTATPASSAGTLLANHCPANPLDEFHILATLQS